MSNAIYKKDLHDVALAVAQGSKNYTDKTKEEIYWHIGDYSVSTSDDNTTASTKTVPTGATRLKIKRVYGLTEKFNPSIAYDDASTMTKTMPNIVYNEDVSVVYGNSEVSEGFEGIHNFAWNGITIKDSNDTTQESISIDLSSILYNGSPLFEGNSLKGIGSIKDEITPYKATKKIIGIPLKDLDFSASSTASSGIFRAVLTAYNVKYNTGDTPVNALIDSYETMAFNPLSASDNMKFGIGLRSGTTLTISMINQSFINDLNGFIASVQDKVLYAEMNSYIEVSIDWSSTLRGIQGYSNGTITLENTYNMDTANTITYNSIIKENCCAKIVQSRGGSVVKTINLPTVASDGYSAGSVNNVRDFTTSKRENNVGKEDLGNIDYIYSTSIFRGSLSTIKIVGGTDTPNMLSKNYTTDTPNNVYNRVSDKTIASSTTTTQVWVNDTFYTDTTIFKTASVGNPLYYELADASKTETSIDSVDNIIEVQPNDVLSFYDSNDNLVTVPSDLTYRIEVERV